MDQAPQNDGDWSKPCQCRVGVKPGPQASKLLLVVVAAVPGPAPTRQRTPGEPPTDEGVHV